MPTYNRANYIVETIESVRNQTYNNWELIIVDDGSEDNTGETVSRIKDERIRFYKAGRIAINGKIKNIGIEQANGELISFIDSDDLWAETSSIHRRITNTLRRHFVYCWFNFRMLFTIIFFIGKKRACDMGVFLSPFLNPNFYDHAFITPSQRMSGGGGIRRDIAFF